MPTYANETLQTYKSQFDQDVVLIWIDRVGEDFIVRVRGERDVQFPDYQSATDFAESRLQHFYQ